MHYLYTRTSYTNGVGTSFLSTRTQMLLQNDYIIQLSTFKIKLKPKTQHNFGDPTNATLHCAYLVKAQEDFLSTI